MQFVVYPADVKADSVGADTQIVADLFVLVSQSELLEHFHFSRGEILDIGRCRFTFTEALDDAAGDLRRHG